MTSSSDKKKESDEMDDEFPEELYYSRKEDEDFPEEVRKKFSADEKENKNIAPIILTTLGMQELAEHYKEKYDIDIHTFTASLIEAAVIISDLIENAKKNGLKRCGFAFFTSEDSDKHAYPIIWENYDNQENLFLLDTGEYLKSNLPYPQQFREILSNFIPTLQIWSLADSRQIDYSSCTLDAMVVLKDGLRALQFLSQLAKAKLIKTENGIHLFHMPEEMSRTAQKGSFVTKTKPDLKKVVHVHREKDKEGKLTGKTRDITLEEHGKQYNVATKHKKKPVFFGTFTLHKSAKVEKTLKKRWEKKSKPIKKGNEQ